MTAKFKPSPIGHVLNEGKLVPMNRAERRRNKLSNVATKVPVKPRKTKQKPIPESVIKEYMEEKDGAKTGKNN